MNSSSAPKNMKANKVTKGETPKIGEDEASEVSPFNLVVTTNIAKFVDFATLKTMRRVDKIWNEGAILQFKRNCVVVLKSREKIKNELQLDSFIKTTENLQPIKNIRIEVLDDFAEAPRYGYMIMKSEQEAEMFHNILQFVSPTLECLKINRNAVSHQHQTVQFPKLAKLVLLDYQNDETFFRTLFQMTPNLIELDVCNLTTTTLNGNFQYVSRPLFSSLLNADGSRIGSILPNLHALTSITMCTDRFGSIAMCTEDMKFLATLPQPWSKLDLRSEQGQIRDLEQVLENNKGTLINLTLRNFPCFVSLSEIVEFNFPRCFPRLQKLKIMFSHLQDLNNLKLRFGGDEVLNYTKTFPALKTLTLRFGKLEEYDLATIWEIFFPKEVCTSLPFLGMDLEKLYSDFILGRENQKTSFGTTNPFQMLELKISKQLLVTFSHFL